MSVLSADWVIPVEGEPIEHGAVVVEGERVAAVGPAAELGWGTRYEGCAILPGFVNAHSHLEYAVYVGFGDGLPFAPWLGVHIERKARLEDGDAVAIARLGAAQCLASGVTTTADYSFSGAGVRACSELGLRGTVYLEVFGADPEDALRQFEARREAGGDPAAWVAIGISPHAPYSTSAEVYEAAASTGLSLGTHLAESQAETEWLLHGRGEMAALSHLMVDPPGQTGIRLLAERGLLSEQVLAAHCVHADAEEIALLARHRVGVAHCPRSNAMLGCGIAPLQALRAATDKVGLGTDSPASTPSFDVFDELRAAVFFARAREGRPDALSPTEALELATLGGARALGLEAELGSLVPGKRADLTIVSLADSAHLPWEDPCGAVVFGGSPERVQATLVGGDVRYDKGEFEWHGLIDAASSARARMLQRLRSPRRAAEPAT